MHVLVVTAVHHPEDARIRHRQIRELLDAGHRVTYVAPFDHFGVALPREIAGLRGVSIPRADGRRRFAALRAARVAVRRHREQADIVLLHDPELVPAVARVPGLGPVVWDVHEDTAATMTLKPWLPRLLRLPAAATARLIEAYAEKHYHLVLADTGYRSLFRGEHLVVPNTTYVPERVRPPDDDRVVYIGHLTRARGAEEMLEVARLLPAAVRLELIGEADDAMRPALERAHREGLIVWHGFVPNGRALDLAEGALAGLSLRHDEANYRNSWATKAVEYMARGIPTVSTPTPPAPEIVQQHGAGIIVPFNDPAAAAEAVRTLRDDPELRASMSSSGHAAARASYSWPGHAKEFIAALQGWSREPARHEARPGTGSADGADASGGGAARHGVPGHGANGHGAHANEVAHPAERDTDGQATDGAERAA